MDVLVAHPSPARFLRVDAKRRTAIVTLIAGYDGENNGFNFDGYGRGELMVSVPRGWRVRLTCANRGGMSHSCAVVRGPMTITPAFRGAATPILPPGSSTKLSFVASRVGTYRLACLVPGHEEARMYDVLDVTRGGTAHISARAGP